MINFKSFIENNEAIGNILNVVIAHCGPVMQECAIELGILVRTLSIAVGGGGI